MTVRVVVNKVVANIVVVGSSGEPKKPSILLRLLGGSDNEVLDEACEVAYDRVLERVTLRRLAVLAGG